MFARGIVFLGIFIGLQSLYAGLSDSMVSRFLLQTLGSYPASALIQRLTPEVGAYAQQASIVAPCGGINIQNGCEGTDLYFLLISAFAAISLPLKSRLAGLGIGLVFAFLLNQIRIVGLFYAFCADRVLFDTLHTLIAPIVLVILLALYFYLWLNKFGVGRAVSTSA